jgi:hypothetical protein
VLDKSPHHLAGGVHTRGIPPRRGGDTPRLHFAGAIVQVVAVLFQNPPRTLAGVCLQPKSVNLLPEGVVLQAGGVNLQAVAGRGCEFAARKCEFAGRGCEFAASGCAATSARPIIQKK